LRSTALFIGELVALGASLAGLRERLPTSGGGSGRGHAAWIVNRGLMRVSRALIPVDYTRTGQFDQDLAVPTAPLPGLQPARRLAALAAGSSEFEFLRTRLVRERNRAVAAVREARRAVDETVAALFGQ
jgi:hypothetical protein